MTVKKEDALRTLESLAGLIGAAEQLWRLGADRDFLSFERHAESMNRALQDLIPRQEKDASLKSVADSLRHITLLARARSHNTLRKIEFELIPLLKESYQEYYFFNYVFPDKALMKEYYQREMAELGGNPYIDEAAGTGVYKYDLSVLVLAFNKLEYTRTCLENLLRHIPQDLNYELILVNHGSNDGTREFFEGIAPTKQLDIMVNGGGLGAFTRIVEGKYLLSVSNDVIVTENAIRNLVHCMDSDDKIAWVVPTTPNVSNLQTIPAEYKSLDEMRVFASENNRQSDPFRWEQRTRLCNPMCLRRSSVSFASSGLNWYYHYYTDMQGGFNDDREALLYRRNGYKMMLAKDSYCYHFGSVTLKDQVAKQENFYDKGRKVFCDAFGIDPWGTGVCWSLDMMSILKCTDEGHVDILGLNCGMGSNPLKIKESIRENARNPDIKLYSVTDDERYVDDLRGVSDVFAFEPDYRNFHRMFPDIRFAYVVFEDGLDSYPEPLLILKELEKRLTAGGRLVFRTGDREVGKTILKNYPSASVAGEWHVISLL